MQTHPIERSASELKSGSEYGEVSISAVVTPQLALVTTKEADHAEGF